MPISKNPLEYYRYYCASQRRVEQWVQDTERLLQHPPAQSESPTTEWRGFLEDPGLATPISPPALPLEPKHESENRHLAGVPEHDSQACLQCRTRGIDRLDQAHDLDHDGPRTTGQRGRPPFTTKGSHGDCALSQRSQQLRSDDKPVISDSHDVPAVPTSSKHSKDSKQSRHSTSKSKNSGSSSSRRRHHPRRNEVDIRPSIVTYIPYGIVPLLFAMTTGSSAVSLAAASITLAGYLCLEYTNTAEKSHSRK